MAKRINPMEKIVEFYKNAPLDVVQVQHNMLGVLLKLREAEEAPQQAERKPRKKAAKATDPTDDLGPAKAISQ